MKVLATLLLLSYTKLQRTVVTILSFTTLQYPDGKVRHVWLYNANVELFKRKHLFLGIAGILILVFPTLCAWSSSNNCRSVQATDMIPMQGKYRFWTGMLLVARTLLLILFTTNTEASIEFSSLIILVVSGFLLLANTNGAYKKLACNFLESFFYLQLVVFTGTAVVDTSFVLSLIVFLAVLGYHSLCRFKTYFYHLKGCDDVTEKEICHSITTEQRTNYCVAPILQYRVIQTPIFSHRISFELIVFIMLIFIMSCNC